MLLALALSVLQSPERSPVAEPAPAQPVETLQVQVRTRTGFGGGGKTVPGVRVQLLGADPGFEGVELVTLRPSAWRTLGHGAYPDLPHSHPHLVPIEGATGTTDGKGQLLLEVQVDRLPPTALPESGRLLWARVEQPGLCRQVEPVGYPASFEDRGYVALTAREGRTVEGLCVDAQGKPTPAWLQPVGPSGRRLDEWPSYVRSFPDGTFELDLPAEPSEKETAAGLLADAGAAGTRLVEDLDRLLEQAEAGDRIRVELRGRGRLRGRIVDGLGQPVVGLMVDAARTLPEPHHLSRLAAEGAPHRTTSTDADGRFDLTGLAAGSYRLFGPPGHGTTLSEESLLRPDAVVADGSPLELLWDRLTLRVQLVDEHGDPLTGLAATTDRTPPGTWPDRVTLRARRIDKPVPDGAGSLWGIDGRGLADGLVVFEPDAPGRYEVAVTGGELAPAHVTVEVPIEGVEFSLRCRAAPPMGALDLRVVDAEGIPIESDCFATLEPLDAPVPLLLHRFHAPSRFTPDRSPMQVPAGRYRAVVQGMGATGYHGGLLKERELGRDEAVIQVAAGTTTRSVLVLEAGARLCVRIEGRPRPADRSMALEQRPEYLPNIFGTRLVHSGVAREQLTQAAAKAVSLRIEAPGRLPEPVLFRGGDEVDKILRDAGFSGSWTYAGICWSYCRLGETMTSQAIPAGDWLLTATLPGGREIRRSVRLVSGETLDVRLDFGG